MVLHVEGIAKLIADAAGRANGLVDVTMGVTVYPIVDAAVSDVVSQFHGESAIDPAAAKLWRHQLEGGHMVGDDHLMLGLTFCHRPFDEIEATLMLLVKVRERQYVLAIEYAVEVGDASLGDVGIFKVDMCPKGGDDEIGVLDANHAVIVEMNVGTYLAHQTFVHRG